MQKTCASTGGVISPQLVILRQHNSTKELYEIWWNYMSLKVLF